MTPTYDELERAYKAAVASGNEPNLLRVRVLHNPEKAVRRRIGRYLRRCQVQKGDMIMLCSRGRIGVLQI